MTPHRRAAVALLPALLFLLACEAPAPGPAGPETDAGVDPALSHDPVIDPGHPGQGGGKKPKKSLVESQDVVTSLDASKGLKDLVASEERGELTLADLWTGLRLELDGGPNREVRVWAALVRNGKAVAASLSEAAPATAYFVPVKQSLGRVLKPRGPGVFDDPGALFPNPDQWIPGDAFLAGDALTGSSRLPPAAAYFEGNGWIPQPDEWIPNPDSWIPQPDQWVVTGIIDGIYEPAGGPGAGKTVAEGPRLLLAVVPADGPAGGRDGATPGSGGVGGILVQFEEP